MHGLFPGFTARLLGLVNRVVLPDAARGDRGLRSGRDALAQSSFPLLRWLTSLGRSAAERNNQYPGPSDTLRPSDFHRTIGREPSAGTTTERG